ncbi:hypothetical protein STEG23_033434 [Scotinomys teguina]
MPRARKRQQESKISRKKRQGKNARDIQILIKTPQLNRKLDEEVIGKNANLETQQISATCGTRGHELTGPVYSVARQPVSQLDMPDLKSALSGKLMWTSQFGCYRCFLYQIGLHFYAIQRTELENICSRENPNEFERVSPGLLNSISQNKHSSDLNQ